MAVLNLEQQKKQSRELMRAIGSGNADALYRLRRHRARWAALDEGAVRQLVSLHDAQFVLARELGFASWRVNLLASTPATATTEPFTSRSGCAVFSYIRSTKARYAGFCRARF